MKNSPLHVHNQPGVASIGIGVKEFMCIGALPPFDHPHVFIEMGEAEEAYCPYCSNSFPVRPAAGKQLQSTRLRLHAGTREGL